LAPIATFLGKIGREDLDGLSVDEFRKRQKLHRQAEIGAMQDVAQFIGKAQQIYGYEHFINDAGGSICELDDEDTTNILVERTVILYLKPDEAMEQSMIQRAIDDPKPMYYHEDFLALQLSSYIAETGLAGPAEIVPDEFARWIFPRLLEYRRPTYQAYADAHGYTLDARSAGNVNNEAEFLELVTSVLG
jgi:hypothetical protein